MAVAVGVLVAVGVGVTVGVIGVLVAVGVGVTVGVIGVFVGVAVGVFVGVAVGVFVGVAVGVFVGVAVGVFVGVAVGVLVAEGVTDGATEGVTAGVTDGVVPGSEVDVDEEVEVSGSVVVLDDDVLVEVEVGDGVTQGSTVVGVLSWPEAPPTMLNRTAATARKATTVICTSPLREFLIVSNASPTVDAGAASQIRR